MWDILMNCFTFGHGEKSFVMLPGASVKSLAASMEAVASAYAAFAREYTVYLIECGDVLPENASVESFAEEAAQTMTERGIKSADLFGCSLGGMMAQYIAAKHPELVRRLVLASTISRNDEKTLAVFSEWAALAEGGDARALNRSVFEKIYSPAFYERYRDAFSAMEGDGTDDELRRFAVMMRACEKMDFSPLLPMIRCPAFVISSWDDRTLTPALGAELAQRLRCQLFMYSGYGHAVYDEAPDYKERILKFLHE